MHCNLLKENKLPAGLRILSDSKKGIFLVFKTKEANGTQSRHNDRSFGKITLEKSISGLKSAGCDGKMGKGDEGAGMVSSLFSFFQG